MGFLDDLKTVTGQVVDATGTLATGATGVRESYDKVANVFAGVLSPANTAAAPGAKDSQRLAVEVQDDLEAEALPFWKRGTFWIGAGALVAVVLIVKALRKRGR